MVSGQGHLSRKMAAIVHADVAGSTGLVQLDESLAHERIQEAFSRFSLSIEHYGGIVHEIRGDALVAEFSRASDAVCAALVFQESHVQILEQLNDEITPTIRIGVSLGEVVFADGTVTGAGVVLAQRVEQLAEPGGVCITGAIHEALPQYMPFDQENLGEQQVKGFEETVRVYRVALRLGEVIPPPENTRKPKASNTLGISAAVAAIVLLVTGGLAFWFQPWQPEEEPASVERMAFPLPDKPSIAVLPFTNMSGDPEQEYFVDGMTEDLITDLSQLSGLFVIARNSVFTYKGKAVKVKKVAEELGVRYVMEGSVRRVGDQVRINAQLIDAITGGHLWAERYDGAISDVFDLQDTVTKKIVDALALELTPEEVQRVGRLGTDNVEAHDAYLFGLSFYYRRTPESFVKAITHFERATELDPNYAQAHAAIAKIFAQVGRIRTYITALSISGWDTAARARISLAKAQNQPLADIYVVRSWLALNKNQNKRAIAEAEHALVLNPNDVDALEALALALIYAGQPESGVELAGRAMRQNPTLLARPFLLKGLAEFALGNLDVAVDHIERGFELGSEEILYAGILAAARGELGQIDRAKVAFEIFKQVYIRPDLSRLAILFPFSDSGVLKRLAKGLALAGAKVWYTVDDGGYVPLNQSNKLSGPEIESLLSGKRIDGKTFWGGRPWGREQSGDGTVTYTGFWIQGGERKMESGISRIEDDMLCDRWEAPDPLELCSVIFRMPEGNVRTRWSDYVMVTDTGPHPFTVAK